MATHTSSGGGAYGRKFSISRENGQADKNGRPYFFEWVKELPTNTNGRKFETRTGGNGDKHYELFSALDGLLVGVQRETKDFAGTPEDWLILQMVDGAEDYRIEVGRIDSRYSMDIMKRLLDPNFQEGQKLRLSPYSVKDEKKGTYSIGLSAHSGVDGKLEAKRESAHLAGMPEPDKREWKGKIEYDFSPVAEWLYTQVETFIAPKLVKDPISAPGPKERPTQRTPAMAGDDFPTEVRNYENNTPDDSLPF